MNFDEPTPEPRKTFSVTWSRPCGRFGFTTIEDCIDAEEAACHFFDHVRGTTVPKDAMIDAVHPVRPT